MGVTVRHQSAIQLCCESGVEDRNYQNKKQYEVFHSFFFSSFLEGPRVVPLVIVSCGRSGRLS